MTLEEADMEQKLAAGPRAMSWEWAPQTTSKFDNRAYILAAHSGWADAVNQSFPIQGEVEAQTLPRGFYTPEHQATTG